MAHGNIVDLPNLKIVIFHSHVSLPEGKLKSPYATHGAGFV